MAAHIHRLRVSSSRCLGTSLFRGPHGRAPGGLLRGAAGLLSGAGRPVAPPGRAQHTEAAAPVEVDLKRLEGEDDGRIKGQKQPQSRVKHAG